ncbi:MAG: TetR/AcrR family transcriptional regulator [Holophagae bacterium]|jgi:TetR/AcrR family transcriptional regulator
MSATTRHPEATRAAIIEAAEALFLEKGYGATAMSAIASRAGVTKSLLHHHYNSKANLWAEVKQRRFRHYAEVQLAMIQDAPDDEGAKVLRDSFEFYYRFLQQNPELVKIMAWVFLEQDANQDVCLKIDDELMDAGAERIKRGQQQGFLRDDVDPRFLLFTFLGICQHWFQDRHHVVQHVGPDVPDEVLDEKYLRDAMKIFFEGVLPR